VLNYIWLALVLLAVAIGGWTIAGKKLQTAHSTVQKPRSRLRSV